jgi:hypothetical protein
MTPEKCPLYARALFLMKKTALASIENDSAGLMHGKIVLTLVFYGQQVADSHPTKINLAEIL